MVGEHVLVAAVFIGVATRTAEYLAPPGGHMGAVLLVYPSREERREQLVGLDAVVEGVDEAPDRSLATGPLVQSRRHRLTATYFVSRYSWIPSLPPSRPTPDCLTPPKGAPALETMPWLRPTMPVSTPSQTRSARLMSRV